MDTTKQHQSPDGQDSSDDLIAELARLVAQDARSTSANSDAYRRVEPSFAPRTVEPVAAAPAPAQSWQAPEPRFHPEPEPAPSGGYDSGEEVEAFHDQAEEAGDAMPAFDFGFEQQPREAAYEEPQHSDVDPIADLIAHAEEEAFTSDADEAYEAEPEDDLFEVSTVDPEPQYGEVEEAPNAYGTPAYGAYEYEPRFEPAPEPVPYAAEPEHAPVEPESAEDRDPLSEIEALIGEAARMNVAASPNGGRRVKSSFLGEDEDVERADRAVSAAESAILAAAAATGARVQRVTQEPSFADDTAERLEPIPDPLFAAPPRAEAVQPEPELEYEAEAEAEDYPAQRRRRGGGFLIPVVAGVAILAAMGAGYFFFFAGPTDPTDAPVLLADGQPLKQEAEPSTSTNAASQSVVFNEIEGNTTPAENEALVSRDQTDGATGSAVSSILAPEEGEIGLANRPVRTVTVRPDGTIVMGEDSVAGSNVLPVERPDVPAVPNSTLTADPIGEAIAAAMAAGEIDAAETPSAVSTPTPVVPAAQETTPATPEPAQPAVTPAPVAADETAPRPVPRPAGLTAPSATLQTPAPVVPQAVASVEPVATPAPVATPSTAGAWVQLSSQRSEEVARAGMSELQSRYGALFNGASLEVSRVDLGDRGIYYRVRLPQPSMADANSICNAIKGQGGDCFVLNN